MAGALSHLTAISSRTLFRARSSTTQHRKHGGLFAAAHVRSVSFPVCPEPDSAFERSLLKFDLINISTAGPDSLEIDRDLVPGWRGVRHVLPYRVFDLELAAFLKQENASSSELLRDRTERSRAQTKRSEDKR